MFRETENSAPNFDRELFLLISLRRRMSPSSSAPPPTPHNAPSALPPQPLLHLSIHTTTHHPTLPHRSPSHPIFPPTRPPQLGAAPKARQFGTVPISLPPPRLCSRKLSHANRIPIAQPSTSTSNWMFLNPTARTKPHNSTSTVPSPYALRLNASHHDAVPALQKYRDLGTLLVSMRPSPQASERLVLQGDK